MKTYEVFENGKSHGVQYAETELRAIGFTRMEMFAAGSSPGGEGWRAEERDYGYGQV